MPMRVLAIADVYEALTSDRPYRRAHSSDQALAVMRREVPARLDPTAFAALEQLLGDGARAADPARA
jgi:HD-GYP domain-containing protein (c-di-GMP phosphodiesterase class II)